MKRTLWEFQYRAGEVAEQAKLCVKHHTDRFTHWSKIYGDTIKQAEADGLTIEKPAASIGYLTGGGAKMMSSALSAGAVRLVVNNKYQEILQKSYNKMLEHNGRILDYDSYVMALSLHPEDFVMLHVDDINFFYRFVEDEDEGED